MLQSLLAEGRPLLADGATGTNLFAMGLTSGNSPELWNAEHPTYRETASGLCRRRLRHHLDQQFRGRRRRLMLHRLEGRTRKLNRVAAEIAREVADSAGRPVVVAGSVGPTGDLLAPLGPLSEDEAVDVFIEQIEGLREGGNMAWIETMWRRRKCARRRWRRADADACPHGHCELRHGRPHDDGRCARGVRRSCPAFDPAPVAFGANCGVGASDLLAAICGMAPGATLIAKANAGVPNGTGPKSTIPAHPSS